MLIPGFSITTHQIPVILSETDFSWIPGICRLCHTLYCRSRVAFIEDLKQFRQWGSKTPGHPEVDTLHGIENTSGPLGQGHAMALGAAIAERFMVARFGEWMAHKTYTYISDGGIQEEISQGVGRIAGHLGLSNLIMYYDSNNIQLSTTVEEVNSEDIAAKYRAWDWNVINIDGNSAHQIRQALEKAVAESKRPTLIIGKPSWARGGRCQQRQF